MSRLGRVLRATWRLAVRGRWLLLPLAAYLALGAWLAFHADLLILDAMSRAAHAFFVWHNDPAKLANIGFAWPPLLTLPLLPFTWYEPLGRTGFAGVIASAALGATAVALIRHETGRFRLPLASALLLTLAVAVNPMFAFYSANGMSEMFGLTLPAIALAACLRHFETRSTASLAVASFAAAGAMLSRYESGVVVLLVLAAAVVAVPRERRTAERINAVLLFAAAPAIYGIGMWMFFNWTVQGSPFWFLTAGNQIGTVTGDARTVDAATASLGRGYAVPRILLAQMFFAPLAMMLAMAMLLRARKPYHRLQLLVVAGFLTYNLVTNVAISTLTDNAWFAQQRFNMRAIPLAPIAWAWYVREFGLGGPEARSRVLRATAVALSVGAIGTSAWVMWRSDVVPSFGERAFLEVLDGKDHSGEVYAGTRVGCKGARAMAHWIEDHVEGRQTILADDSSAYAVMMMSGHPGRFLDTADHGRAFFLHNLTAPNKGVSYILSTNFTECAGVGFDDISERYPDLYERGEYEPLPGLEVAHREHGLVLWRLPPHTQIPGSTHVDD